MGPNNISRIACKRVALANGWEKMGNRNVLEINGEQWSFSMSNGDVAECRQLYSDTVGFITQHGGKLYSFRVAGPDRKVITRKTPSGLSAYNAVFPLDQGYLVENGEVT